MTLKESKIIHKRKPKMVLNVTHSDSSKETIYNVKSYKFITPSTISVQYNYGKERWFYHISSIDETK